MAEVAPAPAKKAVGAAKVRKPAVPSVKELLMQAVAASKERGGISLAALKKSLAASGYDVEKNNSRVKLVLRSLVTKGTLVQIKGTGASGSFKLNKKRPEPKDKETRKKQQSAGAKSPKSKKPTGAAKKVKKASGAGAKKPVKKAVKKPASVATKKPKTTNPKKPKSPAKPLKAKAKVKPKASTKAKPAPKQK